MTETKWQSVVDLVIPHPTQLQILIQQIDGQWRLPNAALDEVWAGPIGRLNDAMQQQLGLQTTVLRQLAEQEDKTAQRIYFLYLLENPGAKWSLPASARWVDASKLDQIILSHPAQRAVLADYFGEAADGIIPARRVLWALPGWRRTAEAWMQAQLAQLGYTVTGPIEQVKTWFLSCILRAPTAQGWVYFKTTNGSPLMVNEAQLTAALARFFPHALPQPLAIEPRHDWMLLADFGGEIGWNAAIETREAALVAFAQLQIASVLHIDELLAVGCIDRRLPKLAEQIEPLLRDPEMMGYIDADQQKRLLAAAPRLASLCEQMAHYNVPATLVHGDMHMSNVARHGEDFLFFDWSDACIAHPFLDMIAILHEKDTTLQARLRDRYLAAWTGYEPMPRLLELWALAYPLCALHQAVSYRFIIKHAEAGCNYPMIGWAMPFWFGKILEALSFLHEQI